MAMIHPLFTPLFTPIFASTTVEAAHCRSGDLTAFVRAGGLVVALAGEDGPRGVLDLVNFSTGYYYSRCVWTLNTC